MFSWITDFSKNMWFTKTTIFILNYWLTLCGTRKLQFFYVEILPEFKNRPMPKTVIAICKQIIKVKNIYMISGMYFSSWEFSVCVFAPDTLCRKGNPDVSTLRNVRSQCCVIQPRVYYLHSYIYNEGILVTSPHYFLIITSCSLFFEDVLIE